MAVGKEVLAVGIDDELWARLGPALGRAEFELNRVRAIARAFELVRLIAFDVVLVGVAEEVESASALCTELRSESSASRSASLLLFAPPHLLSAAQELAERSASRALSTAVPTITLQESILGLLRARPRLTLRVMARLTVQLEAGTSRLLCQTRDLSRGGLLVLTEARFPIGTHVRFALDLPGERASVDGEAEVVRHAERGRDPDEGLGLRFARILGDGERRLVAFLEQHGG